LLVRLSGQQICPCNYEAEQNYGSTPIYLSCLAFLILLCLTPHLINKAQYSQCSALSDGYQWLGWAGPLPAWLGFGLLGDSYGRGKIYGIELVILIVATVGAFTRYEL
jgi:hypothetical protein